MLSRHATASHGDQFRFAMFDLNQIFSSQMLLHSGPFPTKLCQQIQGDGRRPSREALMGRGRVALFIVLVMSFAPLATFGQSPQDLTASVPRLITITGVF